MLSRDTVGGCRDGSAPMCCPAGGFRTGNSDVLLAELDVTDVEESVPFWMSRSQYAAWSHTRLIVDVVEDRGSGSVRRCHPARPPGT